MIVYLFSFMVYVAAKVVHVMFENKGQDGSQSEATSLAKTGLVLTVFVAEWTEHYTG